MKEPKSLLELYKLLWEQIKDKPPMGLTSWTRIMREKEIITGDEETFIDNHILLEKSKMKYFLNSKAFVQQQIKELENDK